MNSNVESLKNNFNKNVSNLKNLGTTKRELWSSKRRYKSY